MRVDRSIQVAGFDFTFSADVDDSAHVGIDLNATPVEGLQDTFLIHAILKEASGADFDLHCLSIRWTVPVIDMHGLYFGGNPGEELTRLPYWWYERQVAANIGVPYIALINRTGESRAAFGLLDQLTETMLHADLSEATRSYHFNVEKPATKQSTTRSLRVSGQWEEHLFVSTARHLWPDVLKRYVKVTDQITQRPKMPVPDIAYEPVFCSWTAIHHDVSHEWIMRNAKIASGLGFKTWITDDGWFIPSGKFGNYRLTGDWQPYTPKFPDMAAHVKAVQELGFRYVLWVSPFMVGNDSQAAQRYAHLLTPGNGSDRLQYNNLAPWEAETQTIIANLLERLVKDYDLDGLKIDFIDSVRLQRDAEDGHPAGNGAVKASVGESIYSTLKFATDQLLALKPDILIEYRNAYANLASRSYANIYRSSDVPINFTLNRWQAVTLRLLTPDRAVHLDPAIWHPNDTDENVAVHLINCIVSVPMVSIELDQYPQSHLELIRYWIGFYNEHRETIIHGELKPTLSLGFIPIVRFVGMSETIVGLYGDVVIPLEPPPTKIWLLNASTRPYIALSFEGQGWDCEAVTYDKFGRVVARQPHFTGGPLPVEVGGSIELIPC